MAIKILREPATVYTMQCDTCDAVFAYESDDLHEPTKYFDKHYVTCPCCGNRIPHSKRERGKNYENSRRDT